MKLGLSSRSSSGKLCHARGHEMANACSTGNRLGVGFWNKSTPRSSCRAQIQSPRDHADTTFLQVGQNGGGTEVQGRMWNGKNE